MSKLTDKQQLFVMEYLVDLNATQAAIRAGYSEKTAKAIGHENLTKPDIQAALQKAMDKRVEKTELTADYVLQGIKEIAEVGEKDSDRLKAFELLGKHMKLFTDKVDATVKGDVNVQFNIPRPKRGA